MYLFPRAAVINYHYLGGLKQIYSLTFPEASSSTSVSLHQNQDFGRTPSALPGGSKGDLFFQLPVAAGSLLLAAASLQFLPLFTAPSTLLCVSNLPLPISYQDMCGVTFRTQPDDPGRLIPPHQDC